MHVQQLADDAQAGSIQPSFGSTKERRARSLAAMMTDDDGAEQARESEQEQQMGVPKWLQGVALPIDRARCRMLLLNAPPATLSSKRTL